MHWLDSCAKKNSKQLKLELFCKAFPNSVVFCSYFRFLISCPLFAKNVLPRLSPNCNTTQKPELLYIFRRAQHKDTSDNTEFHSFRQWDSNHQFKIQLLAFKMLSTQRLQNKVTAAPYTLSDFNWFTAWRSSPASHSQPHISLHSLMRSWDCGHTPVTSEGGKALSYCTLRHKNPSR